MNLGIKIDPEILQVLNETELINEHAVEYNELKHFAESKAEGMLDHVIKCVLMPDTQYVNHWYNEIWAIFHDCIRRQVAKRGKMKVHWPTVAELTNWLLLSCVSNLSELAGRIAGDASCYSSTTSVDTFTADYTIGKAYDAPAAAEAIWQFYLQIAEFAQTESRDDVDSFKKICQDILGAAGQYELQGRHSLGRN